MKNQHQATSTSQTVFTKTAVASAISAAILFSSSVYAAEQTDEEQAEKGNVITVTANRREQSIKDVPINITAVSGDDLVAGIVVDSSELMRNVAGITVVDRGYRNSGAVNGVIIRGVNVDSGTNGDVALSAVPTVGSYVNETPLYANFILKDIQQVEILRGPQGTLYGSGSLAGTVRYRMNKPDLENTYGSVSVNYGQTNGSDGFNLNTDIMVNVPLSDKVALRANYGVIDNDGIVDYSTLYQLDANGYAPQAAGNDIAAGGGVFHKVKDADTVDIDYGRLSLLVEATEDLSMLLSYQKQSDEIGGRRQVTRGTHFTTGSEQAYGEYENGAATLEPSEREVDLTALEIEWDLGFATLASSSSKYSHSGNSISDNTGFYAQNDWFTDLYYGSPRPFAIADRGYEEEAFVQEIRLVSNETVNNIDWIIGAYYMDQDTLATQDSYMPGYQEWAGAAFAWWPTMGGFGMSYTDNDFHYERDQNFTDKAFFGELTYHFSDDFRATVGVRNFSNEFSNETFLQLPIWPFLGAEVSLPTEEDDTLFKFNASYDMNDSTMLYATIAEGYRRGGANAVPLNGSLEERPEWQQYSSDSTTNFELGIKGVLAEKHSYTASVFRIDWDNPQLNTATSWGFFAVANGKSAETQGIELELKGYLADDWGYSIGYAHVSGKLTDDFYAPSGIGATDPLREVAASGSLLPSTPEDTLSVAMDYSYSLSNGMYLTTQINGYFQSDSLNALADSSSRIQADIDGFSLWNISTRLQSGGTSDWNIALYIKNIFNEDGVTGLLPEAYMGTDPVENFLGNSSKDFISQPRTIGVSATFNF